MTWLEKRIRLTLLTRLAVIALVICALIALMAQHRRYFENYFAAPYDIPASELIAAPSASTLPRYWIRIKSNRLFNTGIAQEAFWKSRRVETPHHVTGFYKFAHFDGRLLIVLADREAATPTLTGELVTLPLGLADRLSTDPQVRLSFLPFMLVTDPSNATDSKLPLYFQPKSFQTNGTRALIGAGLTLLVLLWIAVRTMRGVLAPATSPKLLHLGTPAALPQIDRAIKADLDAGRALSFGRYKITSHSIVRPGLRFDIQPLSTLLCAYHISDRPAHWAASPKSTLFLVDLCFVDGTIISHRIPQPDALFRHIAKVAPWAFTGCSPQLESDFKYKRPALAAKVAQRLLAARG
jgi:hypothetical protein